MDSLLLDSLLQRASLDTERDRIVAEGHLHDLAAILCQESEGEQTLPALEVVFYLSLNAPLRPLLVAYPGLLDHVKKLQSRGRLKQKKVALATAQNLHVRSRSLFLAPLPEFLLALSTPLWLIVSRLAICI